jgi:hypothetical protein
MTNDDVEDDTKMTPAVALALRFAGHHSIFHLVRERPTKRLIHSPLTLTAAPQ